MSFQICIKTDKSLQQLATEIRNTFSLPPFKQNSFSGESYCQFEMLGMLILVHRLDEEDRDPEVMHYPYCFDLQMAFADHELKGSILDGEDGWEPAVIEMPPSPWRSMHPVF